MDAGLIHQWVVAYLWLARVNYLSARYSRKDLHDHFEQSEPGSTPGCPQIIRKDQREKVRDVFTALLVK
jgi:hypothetical protein